MEQLETELVQMPKGLWANIQKAFLGLPSNAFQMPLADITQFFLEVQSGRVIDDAHAIHRAGPDEEG